MIIGFCSLSYVVAVVWCMAHCLRCVFHGCGVVGYGVRFQVRCAICGLSPVVAVFWFTVPVCCLYFVLAVWVAYGVRFIVCISRSRRGVYPGVVCGLYFAVAVSWSTFVFAVLWCMVCGWRFVFRGCRGVQREVCGWCFAFGVL